VKTDCGNLVVVPVVMDSWRYCRLSAEVPVLVTSTIEEGFIAQSSRDGAEILTPRTPFGMSWVV
jgi:hypothetical protein